MFSSHSICNCILLDRYNMREFLLGHLLSDIRTTALQY